MGEIGELVIRGEDVFQGYWGEPELTREAIVDGWLHTGDIARVDEAGYLYLVDRRKDMIISGGFNVYPTEVEATLYQHPDVLEACVISVPDDTWGESVKAVVTLRPGRAATAQQLDYPLPGTHCRLQVAALDRLRRRAAQERQRQAGPQDRARTLLARRGAARQLRSPPCSTT
ncbi:class I adenylate-forming enzyme family protein [Cupriavidus basilensis]